MAQVDITPERLAQLGAFERVTRSTALRASPTYLRVIELARACAAKPAHAGVLSTGEKCAVALLCNDAGMLPEGMTFLTAVDRLEGDWIACCVQAERDGWRT